MTPFQLSLFAIFCIIAYMIIVDKNVADYIILLCKILKLNIERVYWMIRLHPKNPITNLIKYFEYAKIAKQLEKEFNVTAQNRKDN